MCKPSERVPDLINYRIRRYQKNTHKIGRNSPKIACRGTRGITTLSVLQADLEPFFAVFIMKGSVLNVRKFSRPYAVKAGGRNTLLPPLYEPPPCKRGQDRRIQDRWTLACKQAIVNRLHRIPPKRSPELTCTICIVSQYSDKSMYVYICTNRRFLLYILHKIIYSKLHFYIDISFLHKKRNVKCLDIMQERGRITVVIYQKTKCLIS